MFLQARLKLTGLYTLIVAIIVCGFSLYLFQNIRVNLQDADQENFVDMQHHNSFIERTLSETSNNILLADLFIIVMAAGLSYVLAGKTLEPIQQSVEAQRTFAANASHELRTPLTVMKNDIDVLRRNKYHSKDDVEATLNSNLEEIAHMSGIVEDLLLLARSDNQQALELSKMDLTKVLQTVTDKMRVLAENKGLTLVYTPTDSLMIMGSAHHLERVVLNLLQNSIEHTSNGGTITITTNQDPKGVHIRFIDTGTGIDRKDIPHVFTRFYKGGSSAGTGLGLSIVKEIVEQHGGSVSMESSRGIGTTVSIQLPIV